MCRIATSFFGLTRPQGLSKTYYMRLKSASPLVFPLSLSTIEALAQKDQQTLLFLGLFYGAMLIMAGYKPVSLFLSPRSELPVPRPVYYLLFPQLGRA